MFSGKKFVQIFMLVLFFTASFLPTVALGNDGGVVLVLSGEVLRAWPTWELLKPLKKGE